jgi:hypothetical protein
MEGFTHSKSTTTLIMGYGLTGFGLGSKLKK